jgi:probable phosphoglycerate mutase
MKKSLEITLVRHGQTAANASRLLAGWTDVPLTELGREQALRLRPATEALEVDQVWSSDLVRAVETAKLSRGPAVLDARVRELHFGDFEGRPWEELPPDSIAGLRDFREFRAPGGESIHEFRDRVHDFVASLESGRHLVYCHGGVMRLLLDELGVKTFVGNCAMYRLDWSAQRILSFIEGEHSP